MRQPVSTRGRTPAPMPRRGAASVAWAVLPAVLLAACASGPPVPDWQLEARQALDQGSAAYLSGDRRVADAAFGRARRELARTGRIDLAARGELWVCAVHVAGLDLPAAGASACPDFEPLRAAAPAAEQAYADWLQGRLDAARLPLLPEAQRAAATAGTDAGRREAAVRAIEDPLARLVAAAVALRDGAASPGLVTLAVDTASAQGWRRPLLAWLGLQLRRAEAAGDAAAAQALRLRIGLVERSLPGARAASSP